MRRTWALTLVGAAVLLAVVPMSTAWVEAWYSRGLYLAIQRRLTPVTNRLPIAAFDLAILVVAVLVALWTSKRRCGSRGPGGPRRLARGLVGRAGVATAVLYLWFVALWGLNYRREPLARKLDVDERRLTPAALLRLAGRAVEELNRRHPLAHRRGWAALEEWPVELEPAMRRAFSLVGLPVPAAPRPHRTLLEPYFRWVGIDGLVDPFFLETLVDAGLAPFERPFAVAHEWAHLAGVAREGDASFVAWIGCHIGGEAPAYSGWLALGSHVWHALAPSERAAVLGRLDAGPRHDLAQIEARLRSTVPGLRRAAWWTYEWFLKTQRVPEGIESYDELVRLVLGTRLGDELLARRGGAGSIASVGADPQR
jgi:hypothetical protein